jgi:hypothetical protein
MKFNFNSVTENRHFSRLISDKITNLTVTKKIGLLAKIAQVLALVAIGAGLIGMILSNHSMK